MIPTTIRPGDVVSHPTISHQLTVLWVHDDHVHARATIRALPLMLFLFPKVYGDVVIPTRDLKLIRHDPLN